MRTLTTAALITVLASLAGCSDSESGNDDQTPDDRLTEAKTSFDEAEYIDFTLSTDNLPDDLEGLLDARGTGTHEPAFTGEVEVQTALDVKAPLIALDGDVYVKLPFSDWSVLDPADYGAPDPAELMDPEGGISSLFTATEGLEEGDSERDGETVLTSISGTIPGEAMSAVFPSSGSDDFTVTYTLTDDNIIDSIRIDGPFYDGSDDVTYTINLDLDGDEIEIEAPI